MANENLEKLQAVEKSIQEMEKKYGKGTVLKLGDRPREYPYYSTGILPLDLAIGIGGFPQGRIIEIYGPEASGKTLIALQTIAEVQKNGGICAFIDAEHGINTKFAENIGVDVDSLFLAQPDYGEQGLEIAEALIRSNGIDLIVIDSVSALTPIAEIQGEMTDLQMGAQARMLGKALRKIAPIASETNTTVIFINQLREKIGVMFGNPETTSGGRALKFYASVRLDVRRVEQIKDKTGIIGNRVKVKVVKNKMAPPMKEAMFDLMFASGASKSGAILDSAIETGVVGKAGAWLSYKDHKWQGREAAKADLEKNEQLMIEIEKETLSFLKNVGVSVEE